jgi:hypothetical protein
VAYGGKLATGEGNMRSTDGVEGSFLLYLSALAIPFGLFVALMYSLLQPTVLPNAGRGMADHLRPKAKSDWSVELADRQRMEDAAIEEARRANLVEPPPTASAKAEPSEAGMHRKKTVSRRVHRPPPETVPPPPQQFGSLVRRLFSF